MLSAAHLNKEGEEEEGREDAEECRLVQQRAARRHCQPRSCVERLFGVQGLVVATPPAEIASEQNLF